MSLIQLPPPDIEKKFLPIGQGYNFHNNFKEFNFNFENWKESILSKEKLLQDQESLDIPEPADDDEESVIDDNVYATIPDDYNFDIQLKLKDLDPASWRDQDHYKVLGLNEFRWQTHPTDLRRAYRALILKYHPDKGKYSKKTNFDKNAVFACITKSYEFLIQPKMRRSYDSFDPSFDDQVPKQKTPTELFYEIFSSAFERNSRWSKHLLPTFGDENSSFTDIDDFYSAWYDFESWREFTYEELHELDNAEDGYERRWMIGQITKESNKQRKEEAKRIRQLVDNSYAIDPRIKKYKREEMERKEREKLERKQKREMEKQQKLDEENKRKEAEMAIIREQEAEEQKLKDIEKKKKEAAKKVLKKSRQQLRKLITENMTNVHEVDSDVNLICSQLSAVQLTEFKQSLETDLETLKEKIIGKTNAIRQGLRNEEDKNEQERLKNEEKKKKEEEWCLHDVKILVKAANIFPAGATKRWEKISSYYNDHKFETSITRNAKDCMLGVKKLGTQATRHDGNDTLGNDDAFGEFLSTRKRKEECKPKDGEISEDLEGKVKKPTAKPDVAKPQENGVEEKSTPWTGEEQKLLEQALRTFPTSLGKERWDKISGALPTRSKKDCILRYKEICAQILAKKKAAAAANQK